MEGGNLKKKRCYHFFTKVSIVLHSTQCQYSKLDSQSTLANRTKHEAVVCLLKMVCFFFFFFLTGLVFEDSVGDLDNVPKFIKYKIRQDVDYTPATNRIRRW